MEPFLRPNEVIVWTGLVNILTHKDKMPQTVDDILEGMEALWVRIVWHPGENSQSLEYWEKEMNSSLKDAGALGTDQSQGSVLPESAQSGSSVGSGVGNSTGSLPLSSEHRGNTTGNQSDTGRSGSERSGLPVSDGRQSVSSSAPSEGIQVGEERGELNNTYKPGK